MTPAKFETILLGPAAAAVAALRKVHGGSVGIGIEIEPRNRLACLLQPSFVEIGFIIRSARIAAQRSIGMAMQIRGGRITLLRVGPKDVLEGAANIRNKEFELTRV